MKNGILILLICCIVETISAQKDDSNLNSLNIVTPLTLGTQTEKQYLQTIQKNPNNAIAYYNLAIFYADKYQNEYAEKEFDKAIQLDPAFSLAYTGLASLFLASGQLERAVAACEKAIDMDTLSAINFLNLGKVHFQNLRFDEAEQSFKHAIQLDSSISDIYLNLGTLLSQIDRKQDAIVSLKKVLQLNPKDLGAPYSLASIYATQNQIDEAYVFLELAIVNGIKFYDLMQMDPTLTSLRERSKQWKELMKKHFPDQFKDK